MQSRLIVKNFGPIKFVDLDLRNVNVFIGPQASGKSALAKLYTIFKAPRKFLKNGNSNHKESFFEALEEYNIASFLNSDTEIKFESDVHTLTYYEEKINYDPKLKKEIDEISISNENFKKANFTDILVKEKIKKLDRYHFITPNWHEISINDTLENKYEQFCRVIATATELENYLSTQAPTYIAAERSFINIVKDFSFNLLLNKVPIPKHILLLGAELERSTINEIDLTFLNDNLMYRNINGEGRIFINEKKSIKLIEAASGIQSAVNILIPILSHDKTSYQRSFVIEEPELNLFPRAQYALIKLIESLRQEAYFSDTGAIHTYTTHSPYILSAFNNLLYASKVWNKKGSQIEKKLKEIIPVNANIPPGIFSAYQINNGEAESIFDPEVGLIKDNYIDESSDEMADDFDAFNEPDEIMQQLLKSKLGDCKFAATSLCGSRSSYETISEPEFFIFDPPNEINQPVRIVKAGEDHQIKVSNYAGNEICIVKTDKCLFTDSVSKCDCILFNSRKFFLVEIKSSGMRTRKDHRHRAVGQLVATLDILKIKGISLTELDTTAVICFKTDNTHPIQASRSYRREEFRINYDVDLQEGNKIEF